MTGPILRGEDLRPGRSSTARRGESWCGVVALTVVTGRDYETCRRAIARANGLRRQRQVRGLSRAELELGMRELAPGLRLVEVDSFWRLRALDRPTLAAWFRDFERVPGAFYLVTTTGHFLVARDLRVWDPNTPTAGVGHWFAPGRRARVASVYRFDGV